jgi:internalin A
MVIKNVTIQKVVQDLLGKDVVTEEDILSIKELDLERKDLTEISDLAQFVNLEKLILTENCLSDLSPIKGLVHLRELVAGNAALGDLSEEEKEKRKIKGKNHFVDFSFLERLENLTHVSFSDADIENINFVSMLPNLIEFRAESNPIKSIDPLISCQKLEVAFFSFCPITDINVFRNITTLNSITICDTDVSDISPLEGHNDFTFLLADDAKITDITPLKDMVEMVFLTLSGNHVTDITPLLKMQKLHSLALEVKDNLTFEQIVSILPEIKSFTESEYSCNVTLYNCDFTDEQKENLKVKMPSVWLDVR